ncbi:MULTISPECIES: type II toxin-antitoxin system RelE/ParE family toxin [unclassified Bradyrhizobium]|uniref:type II toxin-antitoxin system RelE/ParE family toxin n=1 Tax=unclassified Bradyrhizobium TaxID=2631580 RepID=UPI003394D5DB
MVKLRHKPISNQRSMIPRSTPSMEGGTETALTFCVHEGRMVLLRVFIKKTQKTPQAEIDLAQKRRKEIT